MVAEGLGRRSELRLRSVGTSTESELPAFVTFQLPSTSYGGEGGRAGQMGPAA